jgi:hypothetical protein
MDFWTFIIIYFLLLFVAFVVAFLLDEECKHQDYCNKVEKEMRERYQNFV